MNIINFTPLPALLGGILIGLASTLLLVSVGKIFGISGIVGGLFNFDKGDKLWRLIIVAGLLAGAFFMHLAIKSPNIINTLSTPYLVIGGLLMGFGTRLGSGCTSGHGVCGLSRFSVRSLVATICFMVAGVVTVYFLNI